MTCLWPVATGDIDQLLTRDTGRSVALGHQASEGSVMLGHGAKLSALTLRGALEPFLHREMPSPIRCAGFAAKCFVRQDQHFSAANGDVRP
jgi:hypothetical protein